MRGTIAERQAMLAELRAQLRKDAGRHRKVTVTVTDMELIYGIIETLDACMAGGAAVRERLDAQTARAEEAERKLAIASYVPGVFQCAKCGFRLIQSTLHAHTGAIAARDAPGDVCPNDGSPMWRVAWKDDAEYASARWEEQVNRAVVAEAKLAEAREVIAPFVRGFPSLAELDRATQFLTSAEGE